MIIDLEAINFSNLLEVIGHFLANKNTRNYTHKIKHKSLDSKIDI